MSGAPNSGYKLIIGINPSATTKWGDVDTGDNPGHTIVALTDAQGKLERVFSYGPATHSQMLTCDFPAQSNYPLATADSYTLFEFPITREQHDKAVLKIQEIELRPGTFDATHQCTTKSLEIARAAGLTVPDGKSGVVVYFCPDPGKVPTPVGLEKELLKLVPKERVKRVKATDFGKYVKYK